jgi:hypothetical protein
MSGFRRSLGRDADAVVVVAAISASPGQATRAPKATPGIDAIEGGHHAWRSAGAIHGDRSVARAVIHSVPIQRRTRREFRQSHVEFLRVHSSNCSFERSCVDGRSKGTAQWPRDVRTSVTFRRTESLWVTSVLRLVTVNITSKDVATLLSAEGGTSTLVTAALRQRASASTV